MFLTTPILLLINYARIPLMPAIAEDEWMPLLPKRAQDIEIDQRFAWALVENLVEAVLADPF